MNWQKIVYSLLMFIPVNFVFGNSPNINITPNVLIILTDDQGYADVSCFGSTDMRTPNMDNLINDGMRFNNFYANCPVCSPTRAALLSGRYQNYIGVQGVIRTNEENSWGYLDPKSVLLPKPLSNAGYETALIGKWHLGNESPNLPNERGFQFFKGFLGGMMTDYWTHLEYGKDQNDMRCNDSVIDPQGHATDLFTEWSVDYIKKRKDSRNPWFLYLAYNAPHYPVQPPPEWLEKVKNREPGISEKRAKLVAFVEHLDAGIGKVIRALKETGKYENTLIIFTSDNGGHLPSEANNGPWRDGKGTVYEGGVRIPAGVVWKGTIQEGSVSNANLMTMDIFPTVLEAAAVNIDWRIEGQSFLQILQNQEKELKPRPLFFSRREGGTQYGGQTIEAVNVNGWKLLQNDPFSAMELYNLNVDPYETRNLVDEYPKKVRELNKLLMQYKQNGAKAPWQPSTLYYNIHK